MDTGEERIGLGAAAAILGRTQGVVRRYVEEGRLNAQETPEGGHSFVLSDVEALARELGAEDAEDEVFEGEVMGDGG